VKTLTSVIEPLIIVVLGGIAGAIIAMYLPRFWIFELIE
jgi:type IV pilus assembly protein PilC